MTHRFIAFLASPVGIWSVIAASIFGMLTVGPEATTLALSIFALTLTQLVLADAAENERALHAKLDGLIDGVPDADSGLVGIERKRG